MSFIWWARQVSPDAVAGSEQYQPMIAVNNDGTVGIAWFDTREATDRDSYHLYFTASADGGNTFLPLRKVSSQPSLPISPINLTPFQGFSRTTEGNIKQRFRSAFGRWANGGDYMGFSADADGAFHPFWIDSRSGVFQLWTSRIVVEKRSGKTTPGNTIPKNLQRVSVGSKVAPVTDQFWYDKEKQETVIPIRLKNISTETLYLPISVEVKKLDQWTILNARNGKNGAGAVFDYSSALGDFSTLKPGEMTEAIEWRFKYSGLSSNLSIEVDVTGSMSGTLLPAR